MKSANVFMSALHLVILMLIFGMGAFFVTLYFYPNILFFCINLIIDQPQLILKIGFSVLILAAMLFFVFYMINKTQYLKFNMERNRCYVDSKVVKTLIEKYL